LSSNIEAVIGFGSVVLFAILVLFFSSRKIRTNFPPIFRKITTINKVKRAIGLAVEDGSRLHVSLGSANLIDPSITSAFVGLSALNRIGQLTSTSDLPPITTGGSGGLFLLSQGVLKTISVETNTQAFYNPNYAKITGVTPFSYALGTMESIQDQGINGNVYIGNFSTEAAFFCDQRNEKETITLCGSDSISAQSIFYAMTPDALLGEELFALPAYMQFHPSHQASLRVQDIFRILISLVMVAGVALKIAGVL
jgi:hypothetical protein